VAFGIGAGAGWLLLAPWQGPALGLILYNFLDSALLFGLLGWTIYSSVATTKFLARLQDQVRHFDLRGPEAVPSVLRWRINTALLFVGGLAIALLFIRPQELLNPESLIVATILLLAVILIFLGTGAPAALLTRFRILRAFILFSMALLVGTLGYHYLEGWPLMDGLYMTVITMTTIGYGEIGPLNIDGRIFTIFLSLVAVGIGGYALSTVAAFIVEGDFRRIFQGGKMGKQIAQLNHHIILCGVGRVGMQIATEFYKTRTPFVVIENDPTEIEKLKRYSDILHLQGDATKDEILRSAGVERAKGLVVTLGDDKDNAFIVLSARSLNPDLRIIARLGAEENAEKLRRVGADEIISPDVIGGMRMASMMIRPAVVNFLDEMLRGHEHTLRLEEVLVDQMSGLVGQSLGEANIGRKLGLLVVAIKSGQGQYQFNPSAHTQLADGDILIVIGTPEQLTALQQINARN
jgi:voltage-gated potassium channel